MSTVATRTHTIELALAHANTLGRMLNGAFRVAVDRFGEVEVLVHVEDGSPADFPASLGLERVPAKDHASNGTAYRVWLGMTSSAFGTFETRVVMVMPDDVIPADCESAMGTV